MQAEHRDRFRLRVNDPVFRDPAFGIVAALLDQISFRLVFTNYFQGESAPAKSGFGGEDR